MKRQSLILLFALCQMALFAQSSINISGTTVSAPTAKFPLFGSTSGSCTLATGTDLYRTFAFHCNQATTVTANISNIITADGGSTDDTGLFWYTGTFNPASGCSNFQAVGNDPVGTNLTFSVAANTIYTLVVVGLFGTQDGFAAGLTVPLGTISAGSTLPIELTAFKGWVTENGNTLEWQTSSEINNQGFDIERSSNGTEFTKIGNIVAQGKASTYSFIDKTPLSISGSSSHINYYRLRQRDNDEKETVSKTISLTTEGRTKLKVYPNPVSHFLSLNTEGGEDFQIFNLLGQQVLTGKMAQRIIVSALPEGTYFLKVGLEQVKFIKQ